MHGDRGCGARVDRPGRSVLGDGQDGLHAVACLLREPLPFLAEQQDARPGQIGRLQRHRARKIVDADDGKSLLARPPGESHRIVVVADMLVAVGHHGTPPVPAPTPDDVDLAGHERIRRAHHRPDVEVVCEVLDRDVEGIPAAVEILDDRLQAPVPVLVDDVASVTFSEQLGVVVRFVREVSHPWAHTDTGNVRLRIVRRRVPSHERDTNRYRANVKNAVVNLIRGMLMGVAEVIPGVSGGTVALIVGVYRTLIDAIADAVLAVRQLLGLAAGGPSAGRFTKTLRSLPWRLLIPLVIGMGIALVLGARFLEPLLETHPVQMHALFFGLVLAGIYVPARMVRSAGGSWRTVDYVVALIVAVMMFFVVGLPQANITDPGPVVVFLSAAVAICALVLPGVSGSFLLYTLGLYETTISAVNNRDIAYLAIFALGAVVGLALFVTLLKWLLAHRTRVTLVVITGLMAGSLRALWPWEDDDRGLLAPTTDVASALVLAAVGVLIVVGLMVIERRMGLSEEQMDSELSSS